MDHKCIKRPGKFSGDLARELAESYMNANMPEL